MTNDPASHDSLLKRVATARERLVLAGIPDDEAALDARLLAQHVLGWTTATLFADGDRVPPPGFSDAFERLIQRRERREPNAYLTGDREFWGLTFEVTPEVLVPRPETELLVEETLRLYPHRDAEFRVLDLCTGTGCVGIAIASERPRAQVVASDLSWAALMVAQRNAARLAVADAVAFVCADLLSGFRGPFDLIVANPPYVPTADAERLQAEVRLFEPGLALFSGYDGMRAISRIVQDAPALLTRAGRLLVEHGIGQDVAIGQLISSAAGTRMERELRDLQGIPRVVVIGKEQE